MLPCRFDDLASVLQVLKRQFRVSLKLVYEVIVLKMGYLNEWPKGAIT